MDVICFRGKHVPTDVLLLTHETYDMICYMSIQKEQINNSDVSNGQMKWSISCVTKEYTV